MKLNLIFCVAICCFASASEGSRILNYFLRGGGQAQQQRVYPGFLDLKSSSGDDSTTATSPSNSDRSVDAAVKYEDIMEEPSFTTKGDMTDLNALAALQPRTKRTPHNANANKVVPLVTEAEIELEPLGEKATEIRNLIHSKFKHVDVSGLSEESAAELLKIKKHLDNVLTYGRRNDLLLRTAGYSCTNFSEMKEKAEKTNTFNSNIGYYFSTAKNLKDFLKVVIMFYNKLGREKITTECTKAILASGVFEIKDLPTFFEVTFDEIFQFACKNGLNNLALELVRRRTEGLNIAEGIAKATQEKNFELVSSLQNQST